MKNGIYVGRQPAITLTAVVAIILSVLWESSFFDFLPITEAGVGTFSFLAILSSLPYLLILLQINKSAVYLALWGALISVVAIKVTLTLYWSGIRTDGWDHLIIPFFQLLAVFAWYVVKIGIENKRVTPWSGTDPD